MKYPMKVGIALTQLLNALCGGWPDESTSSRAWRQREKPFWGFMLKVIDTMFFWHDAHCKTAHAAEMTRRHVPPDMRGE